MFDESHYVPILKGRPGEFSALRDASPLVRSSITPLIELPPVPWDFAHDCPAKSIVDHVGSVAAVMQGAWRNERRFFVDARLLSNDDLIDDRHPLGEVLRGCRQLALFAVPVTGLGRGEQYDAIVHEAARSDRRGACLRLEGDDLEDPDSLPEVVRNALGRLELAANDIDLILDFGAITAQQAWTGATVRLLLDVVPDLTAWRSLTLAASSFPLDLSQVDGDSTALLPRAEWRLWRGLWDRRDRLRRMPTYSDYGAAHPVQREIDPRIIQVSAAIRYTGGDEYIVVKGRSLRARGFEQYYDLAAAVVARPEYRGEKYSAGDGYIAARAARMPGPGSPATWRRAGVSQHLAFVPDQIAKLHAA